MSKAGVVGLLLMIAGTLFGIMSLSSCRNSESDKPHRVLVIHSYDPGYADYQDDRKEITQAFLKQGMKVDLRIDYLDCERFLERQENQRMYNFISEAQSWNPDLILLYDDQAAYAFMACKHPFAHQVPVVFGGVNFPNWKLLQKYPNITGFYNPPAYLKTADMAEKLIGHRDMQFWVDNTFNGRNAIKSIIREIQEKHLYLDEFQSFSVKDSIIRTMLQSTPHRERGYMKAHPNETYYRIVDGRNELLTLMNLLNNTDKRMALIQCKRDFTSIRLGLLANSPTFTAVEEGFNCMEGFIGGYFTSSETTILQTVGAASKILNGAKVTSVPIMVSPKDYYVDWSQLRRWNIDVSKVPSDYHIVGMPFLEKYKTYMLVGSITLLIILLAIIASVIRMYKKEYWKRHESDEKLSENERFLSMSLDAGNAYAYRLEKNIIYFDPKFYDYTKMPNKPIYITYFLDFCLYPDQREGFLNMLQTACKNSHQEHVNRLKCRFGSADYQWWEFRYRYNSKDTFVGLCLNVEDVKRKEQELLDAKKRAEDSEKAKSVFLASMSHEIRTPLNAIVGFSNLITSNETELEPEEREMFVNLINSNSDHLLKLINDILDMTRIESDYVHFVLGKHDLTDLFTEVFNTENILMPKSVELLMDVPPEPIMITTDRHRLMQVLINLINNSIKFTERGYIKMGYYGDENPDFVNLFVEDTGKGIPEEKQKEVFERFNKLDEFAQGTGLGLSICRLIIKKFHGTISLKSEENKGSCFTIQLPINQDYNPSEKK
jgi:signal transduction histidine kinase